MTIEGAKKILNKKTNTLLTTTEQQEGSEYYKAKIKLKSKMLLSKIKSLKNKMAKTHIKVRFGT